MPWAGTGEGGVSVRAYNGRIGSPPGTGWTKDSIADCGGKKPIKNNKEAVSTVERVR